MTDQSHIDKRRKYLGSSDSPAIVGVDPWRNAHDIFISKTAELEPEAAPSEAMEIGNAFEAPLLRWAGEELGLEIEPNVIAVHPNGVLIAQLDGRAKGRRVGLEAKTSSLGKEYGLEGTDQVPERVIVQCQHQMEVHELDVVWVPVLTAEFDRLKRKLYKVDRNERVIRAVVERDLGFWNDHVLPKIPPEGLLPAMDIIKRIRRVPGTLASVPVSLVDAYEQRTLEAKLAQQLADDAKAELLLAAGDAEGIEWGDAEKVFTYLEQSRTTVDRKAMERDHPDIVTQYLRESRFRVLRKVNRPKGG